MMLNKNDERDYPCLVLILEGKYFIINYNVSYSFFVDAFYLVDKVPFYSYFDESFCHAWMLNFFRCFFCFNVCDHVIFLL